MELDRRTEVTDLVDRRRDQRDEEDADDESCDPQRQSRHGHRAVRCSLVRTAHPDPSEDDREDAEHPGDHEREEQNQ